MKAGTKKKQREQSAEPALRLPRERPLNGGGGGGEAELVPTVGRYA